MASKDIAEDASFFLYILPLAAGIGYGIYEWLVISHASSVMPGLAYLIVTKSPYLFILSVASILAALIIEVQGTPYERRQAVVEANATRMQILAVIVLIVSFAGALSVSRYSVPDAFSVFIAGRYALIYAFGIVLISLLLAPKQILGSAKASSVGEIIGLLLVAASPLVLYSLIKIKVSYPFAAISALIVAALGLFLFFQNSSLLGKKRPKESQTMQVSPPKQTQQPSQ